MDTKDLLTKIEEDIEKLETDYRVLREEEADFDGTEAYKDYQKIEKDERASRESKDIVLKTRYPKQFEMYSKMKELDKKHAAYTEIARSFATKLYGELDITVERLQKKVDPAKEFLEDLDTEINAKQKEIDDVKASEEYKAGDEKTILVVGKMEKELKALLDDKAEVTAKIEGLSKAIERLKEEQEEYVEKYGEEVRTAAKEQGEDKGDEGKGTDDKAPDDKGEDKKDNSKNNGTKGGNGASLGSSTNNGQSKGEDDLTPEQKAQKEFDDLCLKAELGKLSEEEFDKLAAIMKNPENYDKFGITTGIIFNKSRKITKALKKAIKKPEVLLKAIDMNFPSDKINIWKLTQKEAFDTLMAMDRETLTKEQQDVYDKVQKNLAKNKTINEVKEVSKSVKDERTYKRFSWLLEKEEEKPALPEEKNTEQEKTKPGIIDELEGKTNPPGKETPIPTKGEKTIVEPEKEDI